ncbi:hypothetical protein Acsp03_57000 [Actinomadura sp. NBRC 104412]|nr:hypothetical protein Acsp03_57000 [Actinomadura sp. NBRC 104412]
MERVFSPLLLTETTVFARHQAMGALTAVVPAGRSVPRTAPCHRGRPYQDAPGEWFKLLDL